MSLQWLVIVLLSILVALDSLAVIGLVRQVGVLHLRVPNSRPLQGIGGPEVGAEMILENAPWRLTPNVGPERYVLLFVSPNCKVCGPLLPGFDSRASHARLDEHLLLVIDATSDAANQYVREHGVRVGVLANVGCLERNAVPGTPFVVLTDSAGAVITSGAVNTLDQLETLIDQAAAAQHSNSLKSSTSHAIGKSPF